MRFCAWLLSLTVLSLGMACAGGDASSTEAEVDVAEDGTPEGEPIEPPFQVAGNAEGLVLTYYDDEGPHTVNARDDIPEAHRERVRVDSLEIPPDQREPNHVYVADLRREVEGRYAVRRFTRSAFDALLDEAAGVEAPRVDPRADPGVDPGADPRFDPDPTAPTGPALAGNDVIIYGASWCGACRSAARYLSQRGVPFQEKDIERDQGARAEMNAKARAAGVRPRGIPVIDFRGNILAGFDQRRIDSLIAQTGTRTL